MPKLKPCPFCGGEARIIKSPYGAFRKLYVVGCFDDDTCLGNLNHMAMIFVSKETAAKTWNRRAKI